MLAFTGFRKLCLAGVHRILELSKKRRAGYLAAISRKDMTEKIMVNDRICSRHFVDGKPAPLEDETNPDWLPTQNLGRCKVLGNPCQNAERWIRRKAREDVRRETDEEISITTAESSRDNAVEGLLALASSNLSATGSEGMKSHTIVVLNSVKLKSLVRLFVSQVTRLLAAVMLVFKLICPVLL